MDDAFRAHYELGLEEGRLFREDGTPRLELRRTLELLERFLPPPPADVLDVGGGPGVYSRILGARGYRMRLVDVLPLHVEQARAHGLDARVGDARSLDDPDDAYDAVLLLGPLYHLIERADRVRALGEARRVAKDGAPVVGAAISRYTSLLDGLVQGFVEREFQEIVERDLAGGPHLNPYPSERPEWFTTAYFHHPDDLAAEAKEAGLVNVAVFGVEGPGWMFPDADDEIRLRAARLLETDVAMLAVSGHLLVIGFAA